MFMPGKTPISFKEAVLKDPEGGEAVWNNLVKGSEMHPIIKRVLREGLYSDAAAALGGMQNIIIDALIPRLISREALFVIKTTKIAERFYKGKRGYTFNNEGKVYATGPKPDTPIDVSVNLTETAKQQWNLNFAEDVSWDVMSFESRNMVNELAREENEKTVTLFNAIANGDLAGGAEFTITNSAPTWAQIITGLQNCAAADFYPDKVFMGAAEFMYLFNLDQFISALYNTTPQANGQFRTHHASLGIDFFGSSAVTKTLMIDSKRAGVLLLRSDVQTVPWEDKANFIFGISSRERYGMGIIWPNAVARGTY
jgi:hypothetical protein